MGTFKLLLLAEELLLVVFDLPPDGGQQVHQFSTVGRETIDYFLGVEDILIIIIAILHVVFVVIFLPVRFLLLAESLLGPAQVFIVVVLQVGLFDVVALEDGLALSDAQVVGCGCGGGGGFVRAAHLPPKYIRQRGDSKVEIE